MLAQCHKKNNKSVKKIKDHSPALTLSFLSHLLKMRFSDNSVMDASWRRATNFERVRNQKEQCKSLSRSTDLFKRAAKCPSRMLLLAQHFNVKTGEILDELSFVLRKVGGLFFLKCTFLLKSPWFQGSNLSHKCTKWAGPGASVLKG